MRIAQLSDFHFTRMTWNPLRLFSKRIAGIFNWLCHRKGEFDEGQLASLPQLLRDLGVDLVLLGGDFTSTALHEEFTAARTFVDALELPWIAIPGNHDHYTYRSFRQKHFYRYFSHVDKEPSLRLHGLEVHEIAPNWTLIALDTAIPSLFHSQGLFSKELEGALREVLSDLTGSVLLLNHYPFFDCDSPKHRLQRSEALEALVRAHPNIRLYLHGHTHRHILADLQPDNLPLILDSGCIAHTTQGTWNLIDLSDTGCHVTAYRKAHGWEPFRQESITWSRHDA